MITLESLHKSYGAHEVLAGIDLTIDPGEVVCLIGRSGSGKSTLLRCANLLEMPNAGEIRFDGQLVFSGSSKRDSALKSTRWLRERIGTVFQQFNLFPHLTVLENVTAGPVHVRGLSAEQARPRALELLDRVGLRDKCEAHPEQLSGGQQQRVAIARALAMDPELMLFDEATSALDPELVGDVLTVMRELAAGGMTMMVVTHEMNFARGVADRVVYMDGGTIIESGPPAQIFDDPRTESTKSFLSAVLSN